MVKNIKNVFYDKFKYIDGSRGYI